MTESKQLTIADTVKDMEGEFKLALPKHIPSERFTRIAVTAINSNPNLLGRDVDKRSVYAACMKAAQDGLVIDNREAALVVFKKKSDTGYVQTAQYMVMIAGVLKKMRNSGEISNVGYGLVYKNEYDQGRFKYTKGDNESLTHDPIMFEDKGPMIGVYAVVTLKDGAKVREFMDMKQIEKIRNVSRSKDNGPWKDWFEEMAVKSVLRKVAKLCPSSSDLDSAFKDLDDDTDLTPPAEEPVDATPVSKRTKAADKVKAAVETSVPPDTVEASYEELDGDDLPI